MKNLIKFFTLIALFAISANNIYSQSGWIQQNSGITGNIYILDAVDENTAFIGNPGYKTTDGGLTWFAISTQTITEFKMANSLTGYAVNNDPYKTTNGGLNWTVLSAGAPLYSQLSFIDANTGAIAGLHDMDYLDAFKTTNGGANWTTMPVGNYSWPEYISEFTEIKMVNTNLIYVSYYVFQQLYPPLWVINYMKKSSDGGTWFSTMMWDSNWAYYEMEFPAVNTGFVITVGPEPNRIIKSVNDNWGATISLTSTYAIRSIEFPSVNTGYAACSGGVIYKTTNSGTSWYTLNTGTTNGFRRVKFINELTGWVVGDSGLILKTTTGGEGPPVYSVAGMVKYQDNGLPVTSGYVKALRYDSLLFSIITVDSAQIQSNGTYTLSNIPPGITTDIMAYENDEEELLFVPTYYVSTIYWQNAVPVTVDSNMSNIDISVKRTLNSGSNLHVSGYVYTNSENDYTGLKDAVVYSRSAGVFKGYSISLSNGYYKIDSLPSGVYEIIADRMGYDPDTYIISLTTSSLDNVNFYLDNSLVPVKHIGTNIPDKMSLSQNYPNPFNPKTIINFQINKTCFTTLTVYDISGKAVGTLMKGELSPGTYEAEFDGTGLASGIYFYRIEARQTGSSTGDFIESKKMILIK